jgi:hypothetical protein
MNIQYEWVLHNTCITTAIVPYIQSKYQQEIDCKIVKLKLTQYIGSAVVVCSIRPFLSEKELHLGFFNITRKLFFSIADLRCFEILLSGKLELISLIKKPELVQKGTV